MSRKIRSDNRLAKFLRKRDGHIGRTGETALKLAEHLGASIHLVQSMAMGRRIISDENKAKIKEFMQKNG